MSEKMECENCHRIVSVLWFRIRLGICALCHDTLTDAELQKIRIIKNSIRN